MYIFVLTVLHEYDSQSTLSNPKDPTIVYSCELFLIIPDYVAHCVTCTELLNLFFCLCLPLRPTAVFLPTKRHYF